MQGLLDQSTQKKKTCLWSKNSVNVTPSLRKSDGVFFFWLPKVTGDMYSYNNKNIRTFAKNQGHPIKENKQALYTAW